MAKSVSRALVFIFLATGSSLMITEPTSSSLWFLNVENQISWTGGVSPYTVQIYINIPFQFDTLVNTTSTSSTSSVFIREYYSPDTTNTYYVYITDAIGVTAESDNFQFKPYTLLGPLASVVWTIGSPAFFAVMFGSISLNNPTDPRYTARYGPNLVFLAYSPGDANNIIITTVPNISLTVPDVPVGPLTIQMTANWDPSIYLRTVVNVQGAPCSVSCNNPGLCQTTIGATCYGSTCNYPASLDGESCGSSGEVCLSNVCTGCPRNSQDCAARCGGSQSIYYLNRTTASCMCGGETGSRNCTTQNCLSSQFACVDGECVTGTAACNGVNECTDFSDEQGCPSTCHWASLDQKTITRTSYSSNCNYLTDCDEKCSVAYSVTVGPSIVTIFPRSVSGCVCYSGALKIQPDCSLNQSGVFATTDGFTTVVSIEQCTSVYVIEQSAGAHHFSTSLATLVLILLSLNSF